jgi:hypothetical protein
MNDADLDRDAAWFLAREQGQPGPAIPESRALRYAQLEALFGELPSTPTAPPPGWHERMLAALDAATVTIPASDAPAVESAAIPVPRKRFRGWVISLAAIAAALVIAILVHGWGGDPRTGPGPSYPVIAMTVEPAALHRGEPGVGDTLVVHASLAGNPELRLYDADGNTQASCMAPGPGCRVEHAGDVTTLILSTPIRRLGMFRAFLFSAPLGAASAGLESDVAIANRSGIAVTASEPKTIR